MPESTALTAADLVAAQIPWKYRPLVYGLLAERDALAAERDELAEAQRRNLDAADRWYVLNVQAENESLRGQLRTARDELETRRQLGHVDQRRIDALAAQLAEARGIARRLRRAFSGATYHEKVQTLNDFDALHWPDPAPPAPER